jgi:predicted transposase YdaD
VEVKSEVLVQVYRDNVMKKTEVYKWVTHFSQGRECVTDEDRSGWPGTGQNKTEENITKVRQIVRENCRLTVMSLAEQADIDIGTVRKILTEDLDMMKVCAKRVQMYLLTTLYILSLHFCNPEFI